MKKNPLDSLLEISPDGMNRAQRRNAKKFIQEEIKRLTNVTNADMMGGAGYPIDQQVRSLLKACNEEMIEGASIPFVNIWDVFSGFVKRDKGPVVDILRMKTEKDHAFSALDFFHFVTEEGLQEQTLPRLREITEGVIHNFTAMGDLKDVAFEQEGSDPVVMSGISMVRDGDHLYWIVLGGPVIDLAEATAARRADLAANEAQIRAANPNASEERILDTLSPTAVPLPGTDDVWLSFTMGLFNLKTARHEIRIIARDWGVTLAVFSDQFEAKFADAYDTNPQAKRLVDKSVAHLEASNLYFDLAETAFSLPAYFSTKVSLVAEREVKTALSGDSVKAKHALKAPQDMRVLTRRVSTLDFSYAGDKFDHTYAPPRFRVEVDGYWRRLPSESNGRDADGNLVRGRTWVRGHARWKDKPPKLGVVHVKTPIRQALERAEARAEKTGGDVSIRY